MNIINLTDKMKNISSFEGWWKKSKFGFSVKVRDYLHYVYRAILQPRLVIYFYKKYTIYTIKQNKRVRRSHPLIALITLDVELSGLSMISTPFTFNSLRRGFPRSDVHLLIEDFRGFLVYHKNVYRKQQLLLLLFLYLTARY